MIDGPAQGEGGEASWPQDGNPGRGLAMVARHPATGALAARGVARPWTTVERDIWNGRPGRLGRGAGAGAENEGTGFQIPVDR